MDTKDRNQELNTAIELVSSAITESILAKVQEQIGQVLAPAAPPKEKPKPRRRSTTDIGDYYDHKRSGDWLTVPQTARRLGITVNAIHSTRERTLYWEHYVERYPRAIAPVLDFKSFGNGRKGRTLVSKDSVDAHIEKYGRGQKGPYAYRKGAIA